jgi:Na+-driven multidrug efflux pump
VRLADFRGIRPWFGPLIRIALPGVGERLIMNLAMVVYFAFIGTYGTAAAAAYTIGIRILSFTWIPGTGYAQAVATLVGQALGADDVARAERSGWRAARLALATAIVMGLLGVVLREPLARLFTVDEATVVALGPFMLCLSLAQPAMQLHFTLGGAFRGAGNTMTPLYAAFVGNWLFRVPLAFLAASVWHLPLIWIWLTLILDHLARAIWLTVGFVRGTWHRRSGVVPTG